MPNKVNFNKDDNGEELTDVESVLKKGEKIFKLGDYQSAHNIYTYGLEKLRYCFFG